MATSGNGAPTGTATMPQVIKLIRLAHSPGRIVYCGAASGTMFLLLCGRRAVTTMFAVALTMACDVYAWSIYLTLRAVV